MSHRSSIMRVGSLWKFNLMVTDESGLAIGQCHAITEGDTDRLIQSPHLCFRVCVCECVRACCLQTNPLVPDQSEEIVGSKQSMVDECVSVKQSHSNGHKPLTGNQALLLSVAIMMWSL